MTEPHNNPRQGDAHPEDFQPVFDSEGNQVSQPAEELVGKWNQAQTPDDVPPWEQPEPEPAEQTPAEPVAEAVVTNDVVSESPAEAEQLSDDLAANAAIFQNEDEPVAEALQPAEPQPEPEPAPQPVAEDTSAQVITEEVLADDTPEAKQVSDDQTTNAAIAAEAEEPKPKGLFAKTSNTDLLYRQPPADLFRKEPAEPRSQATPEQMAETLVRTPEEVEAERAEMERKARLEQAEESRRRAEERAARNRSLGVVDPAEDNLDVPVQPTKLVTDKFFGAMGLFLLRMVVAAIMGIRAFQHMMAIEDLQDLLSRTLLPYPETMAWVAAITMATISVLLLLGLMVRVGGFALAVLSIVTLAFLRWGQFNPFQAGEIGFIGEFDLLLAGIGILFLGLGGGAWGLDGSFRRGRARAKAAREA